MHTVSRFLRCPEGTFTVKIQDSVTEPQLRKAGTLVPRAKEKLRQLLPLRPWWSLVCASCCREKELFHNGGVASSVRCCGGTAVTQWWLGKMAIGLRTRVTSRTAVSVEWGGNAIQEWIERYMRGKDKVI